MSTLPTVAYVRYAAGQTPEVDSTVRLTGHTYLHCCTYPDTAPILVIDAAHVKVSVTIPDPGQVTEDDVTWGQMLAQAVARYVAELERIAAANHQSAGPDDTAGRAA
jgi:hypothetical protein